MESVPLRQIRAAFDDNALTVYQAYSPAIAQPALDARTFVAPFKRERMTWIKPSFRWMMYRSGWGKKPGQERVLAVRIRRSGFEWALAHACLSHYDRDLHPDAAAWKEQLRASPVRIQWDPERSTNQQELSHRAIQIGLTGEAVHRYVDDWIVDITDATALAHEAHALVRAGDPAKADTLIPAEQPYPLPEHLRARIHASA
ncbi:DUF4291 domain-containing protein [Streptacidiphilus pinicola]|uniref:DUF4291 domain-containing protein n=1 Tax=Streptacidiphilus pinicola TaxID=2219663 RepID=A0A2X0KKG0_9ACTN|nr:DUF4291 domain-containing protein [Streptacidiphilus pinicola]RAG87449.1 DUF4291 domain-containing protein [Streptacidiphilus pinicola]